MVRVVASPANTNCVRSRSSDLAVGRDPVGFGRRARRARRRLSPTTIAPMEDRAHLRSLRRLDRVGVVPEIEAVHVLVVEPQADVMRMIDALAGARRERPPARDDRAAGAANRIEHRLLDVVRPDVRRERLAADGDVDAPRALVRRHGDRHPPEPTVRNVPRSLGRRQRSRERPARDDQRPASAPAERSVCRQSPAPGLLLSAAAPSSRRSSDAWTLPACRRRASAFRA